MARVRVFNDPDINHSVVEATGVTLAVNSAAGDGSLPSEATEGTATPNHPAVETKQAETVGPSEARGLVAATGGMLDENSTACVVFLPLEAGYGTAAPNHPVSKTNQAENVCLPEVTEGVSAAPKPAGRT
jgi:hypothetical protein